MIGNNLTEAWFNKNTNRYILDSGIGRGHDSSLSPTEMVDKLRGALINCFYEVRILQSRLDNFRNSTEYQLLCSALYEKAVKDVNAMYEQRLDEFIKERDAFYLERQAHYDSLEQQSQPQL